MDVRKIKLNKEEMPRSVVVEMTTEEATFIARVVGNLNTVAASEVMLGGDRLVSEIYGCLTGSFFNRYWDKGIIDAPGRKE